MDILQYIDRFITCLQEAVIDYENCEGFSDNNSTVEVPLDEYDEEVELIWLASQAQY